MGFKFKKTFKKLSAGLDKIESKLGNPVAMYKTEEVEEKKLEDEAALREAQATQAAQEAAANMQRNLGVDLTGVNVANVMSGATAAGTDAEELRKRKAGGARLSSTLGVIA